MKSTGFVRRVENAGRIVLPVELRKTFEIAVKHSMEIYVDGEQIILKNYEPACVFCGQAREISHFKGINICSNCLDELSEGQPCKM